MVQLSEFGHRKLGDELDPRSRASLVVEHVETFADEAASRTQPINSSGHLVRQIIHARTARRCFFETDLFADPAWDILLELYALRMEQRRTSVSKLCISAAVPSTTALRWIEKLQQDGLVERRADPFDARRIWVALTEKAFKSMSAYLDQLPTRHAIG